jgi:hypothetical protein
MTDLNQLIPDDKKREDALAQFVRDIELTKINRDKNKENENE